MYLLLRHGQRTLDVVKITAGDGLIGRGCEGMSLYKVCKTQRRNTDACTSPGAHLAAGRAANGSVYAPLGEHCAGRLQETLGLLHGLPALQQNILAAF